MIPKVIHYCWFGRGSLPELAEKCIESWRKYCPDYEIREWNEGNFDIGSCDYVKEAYEEKKYAFVSDYARFDILYRYGGVYFDTDVELIKPIDDILVRGPFMGLEAGKNERLAPGLGMAAFPNMEIYREILDYYAMNHFMADKDGNYKTVVHITDEIFSRHGEIKKGQVTELCGINIYPPEYFCPLNYFTGEMVITENTRSIHHYSATWMSKEGKKIFEIRKGLENKGHMARLVANVHIRVLLFVDVTKKQGIISALAMTFKFVASVGKIP